MKSATPSTAIQTGFHTLLLNILVVAFAINAWATQDFTSTDQMAVRLPNATCSGLLGTGSQIPGVSKYAERFLTLVNLGIGALEGERQALNDALLVAAQSPYPVNPLLNLSGYLARALAKDLEGIVGKLTQEDWGWLQVKIHSMLASRQQESAKRSHSIHQTSQVNSFQYVSNQQISQALEQTDWHNHGRGSRVYVGSVGGTHLFVSRAHSETDIYYGLVGISDLHGQGAPVIRWVARYHVPRSGSRGQSEELAGIDLQRIWIIENKLYLVMSDDKTGSDVLAQVDYSTGSVLQKYYVPDKGKIQIWNLGKDQIVAINYAGIFSFLGRAEAKRFYKFDPNVGAFVKTGLDVGFIRSRNLSLVRELQTRKLVLGQHGYFTMDGISLFLDHTDKDRMQELNRRFGSVNTFDWSLARKAGVRIYDSDDGRRYLTILIFGQVSKVYGAADSVKIEDGQSAERSFEIEIPNNIEDVARLSVDISELPGTQMNVVYISALLSPPSAWLVDRDTLQFRSLRLPNELSPDFGQWSVLGRQDKFINRTINSLGEYVLSLTNRREETFSTWILNPETLAFEDNQVIDWPVSSDTGPILLAPDAKTLMGQITKDGLWLASKFRTQREGAK